MALEVATLPSSDGPDFDRNMALGLAAIERFTRVIAGELPKASYIRALRPPDDCFLDLTEALNPNNPHNLPHVARLFTYGIPFIDIRQRANLVLPSPREVLIGGIRYHDCRLKDWPTYPDHGLNAAEWLEQNGKAGLSGELWDGLRFVLIHHSDPVGTELPFDTKLYLRELLYTMQDIDASELMRPGTRVTDVSQITLRTEQAKQWGLPYISYALQQQLKVIQNPTGDIYEDQIQAGVELHLIQPDETQ